MCFVLADEARTVEALPHALNATEAARQLGDPGLLAEAPDACR